MAVEVEVPAPPVGGPRWTLRRVLAAPAPVALVLAVGVLAPAATYLVGHTVPPATHLVDVGVSAYPATVAAVWHDRFGGAHLLDPWTGHGVNVPARDVTLAVVAPGDGSIQCTVTVDGTGYAQTAERGAVALCTWTEGS